MPKAKRSAADSGSQKTNSRKTVEVIVQRTPKKIPPVPSLGLTLATSKSLTSYPSDSHQNDMVVNSVEAAMATELTGLEHYRHQLRIREDYGPVYTDSDTYRCSGSTKPGLRDIDDEEEEDGIEEEQHDDYRGTSYSKAPAPPSSFNLYEYQIYTCTATNPAVFLAITRIAQRNLPFINFQSALNHLPNLPPTSQLPILQSGVLAEDMAHKARRGIDDLVVVLFLPSFYHDGRHALGYYVSSTPARSYTYHQEIRMQDAKQMLFTPCTQADLEMYGLITYSNHPTLERLEGSGKPDDEEYIQSVGVKGGRWLGSDRVEDWDEWKQAFKIVEQVWEARLRVTGLEDLT